MEDFDNNSNSGNLTNATKRLTKFDGRKPSEFRDWHKKLAVNLGVTRRDIARLVKGQTRLSQVPALSVKLGLPPTRPFHCKTRQIQRRSLRYPLPTHRQTNNTSCGHT